MSDPLICGTCLKPITVAAIAYGHGRVFCSGRCREAYPGHDEAALRSVPEPLQTEIRECTDGPFRAPLLNWVWAKGVAIGEAMANEDAARKQQGS